MLMIELSMVRCACGAGLIPYAPCAQQRPTLAGSSAHPGSRTAHPRTF
jgi:hypothetical protein